MAKTRVLVVEDSLTVRMRLAEILDSDPEIELVGQAADGQTAIECCEKLRPDVVTIDMMLPVVTGLVAIEHIMAFFPTPILVVSASFNRGELFQTYEALAAGAVDVMEKPNGTEAEGVWERGFLTAVKLVARIRVITHPRARLQSTRLPVPPRPVLPDTSGKKYELLAIGASTGGPGAIVEVLRSLPEKFRLPILFVLHLSEPFGPAFAEWLDGQSTRRVSYAQEGESVAAVAGRVVMAPAGKHLIVRDRRLHLTGAPERWSCRPSIDVLFESIAPECGPTSIACLLTGMGRDGAQGLLGLRQAGALTIAQDEASSVVYGMPREAALLGAACEVLPLSAIAPRLIGLQTAAGTSR